MKSQNPPDTDVVVLGAGIVGICSALSALERGLTVTVIDKGGPGEATSFGNAGIISPWSCVPQCTPGVWKNVPKWFLDPMGPVKIRWRDVFSILPWTTAFLRNANPETVEKIADSMDALMRDNVSAYRRFLAGTGKEDLIADSHLVAIYRGDTRPDTSETAWRLRTERGATVEFIGAADLRDLEPAVSTEYHSAAVVRDQARTVSPAGLCTVLADKAKAMGAVFCRAEVIAIRPQEDKSLALQFPDSALTARKLILCGGIWSSRLLEPLGIKIPLIAERGYHLEFADPGVSLNNSIQDMAGKVIISSMAGGIRTAGTAEFADIDAPPNYARARVLEPLTKRVLPALNTSAAKEWMGIRPSFPDNLPAIGPVPGIPNLIAAFGHSHYGLGMAPATGRIAADIVNGVTPNMDVSSYRIDRFRG